MLIFFNISSRTVDSNGHSLEMYCPEIGDEMIAEYENGVVTVDGYPAYGGFVFNDPKPNEISPYVSLNELTSVRVRDGRFNVGGN